MTTPVLGLDIGGANLKAAHSNGSARSIAFALWKYPERLVDELATLCAGMPPYECLAVTMTGELCDCFESKQVGVRAILQSVLVLAGNRSVRVWCTQGRFLDYESALQDPHSVAAANWLALAHLVARQFPADRVLLIDTGSTTTDIVYLNRGVPEPRGLTDTERLATGGLVYTAVRRTPICAVRGFQVAAEFFATMLDAYLCAGLVQENLADCNTADGRPATFVNARARLARMLCADSDTFSEAQAHELALLALQTQWQAVQQAMERVVENRSGVDRVVLSGSGAILGRSVCARYRSWATLAQTSLAEVLGPALSEAACAYAVAKLAAIK